jgi:peptidoglycan/xylan/chitin deacetylase (PgdA/CDA1 family)
VQGQSAVVITFDDGFASCYSIAFEYMRTKGVRGTSYIITGRVGKEGYMTVSNLAELYGAGIAQGFFCNFDQVFPRNFILRSI